MRRSGIINSVRSHVEPDLRICASILASLCSRAAVPACRSTVAATNCPSSFRVGVRVPRAFSPTSEDRHVPQVRSDPPPPAEYSQFDQSSFAHTRRMSEFTNSGKISSVNGYPTTSPTPSPVLRTPAILASPSMPTKSTAKAAFFVM